MPPSRRWTLPVPASPSTRLSAPSLRVKAQSFTTATACWAAAGSASTIRKRVVLGSSAKKQERTALDKQLFFAFHRRIGIAVAAAGTQQIQSHSNSLHQCRSLMHRPPDGVAELCAGILYGLQRSGKNAVRAHELAAQPVGGFGEKAVGFLRLPARQIHYVRGVGDHFCNLWLRVFQKNLHAAKNRPEPRRPRILQSKFPYAPQAPARGALPL